MPACSDLKRWAVLLCRDLAWGSVCSEDEQNTPLIWLGPSSAANSSLCLWLSVLRDDELCLFDDTNLCTLLLCIINRLNIQFFPLLVKTRHGVASGAVRPLIQVLLQTYPHGCPGNDVGYVLRQSKWWGEKNEDASSCCR